jgi:glycerol uptake facilitator-like aquaporin
VCIVLGSGILGSQLSNDQAVVLLINMVSTVLGLGVLIFLLQPVSGAVLNPIIAGVLWRRGSVSGRYATALSGIQIIGAGLGAVLANVMFHRPAISLATTTRSSLGEFVAEIIATAGLVAVVCTVIDRGNPHLLAVIVPAWIGSAYLFTSSTSFANPAVTLGRTLSDSFAGISPGSVGVFLLAQAIGGVVGVGLAHGLIDRRITS